jgi:hypothetical protein
VNAQNLWFLKAVNMWKIAGLVLMAAMFLAPEARAGSIVGSWYGGGIVTFSDGHRERARCRASYSQSGRYVSLSGVCATASGSADQAATLRRTGANSYSGAFYNATFGIRGTIHVSIRGNSQHVSLRGGGGRASLTLRRSGRGW